MGQPSDAIMYAKGVDEDYSKDQDDLHVVKVAESLHYFLTALGDSLVPQHIVKTSRAVSLVFRLTLTETHSFCNRCNDASTTPRFISRAVHLTTAPRVSCIVEQDAGDINVFIVFALKVTGRPSDYPSS